jgi:branched-chain amino acid transport system substrate-binding protein
MVKVALLIGVSEYQSGFSPLPKAKQDIKEMQRVLQNRKMDRFDQIQLMADPDSQSMCVAIETIFAGRSKEDLVVLFFSGHGIKDDRGKLYFATRDTRKTQTGELIRSTAVAAGFIQELMSNSRCKRQVVILDCCFSGAFAEGMEAKDSGLVDVETQLGGEGRAVLRSLWKTSASHGRMAA